MLNVTTKAKIAVAFRFITILQRYDYTPARNLPRDKENRGQGRGYHSLVETMGVCKALQLLNWL
jgi:hypothetical protein